LFTLFIVPAVYILLGADHREEAKARDEARSGRGTLSDVPG
jgi:hypothetical protein